MEMKQKTIEIMRFDVIEETKLLKTISKLLHEPEPEYKISEEEALKLKVCSVMDPANVCLFLAKTEEAKRILSRFIDRTHLDNMPKVPELDYVSKEESISRYSLEYLIPILNVLKVNWDSVKIGVKFEYPMIAENDHFKIILAPRVEND